MKRTFGRSEKVKAASRAALAKLRSMSPRELLDAGAKHVNSDIAIMLSQSAEDYCEDVQERPSHYDAVVITASCLNLWHERYQVFKDVYAQGFVAAQEQLVAFELTSSYRVAGAVHALQSEPSTYNVDDLEYSGFLCANDGVPALSKCVAA